MDNDEQAFDIWLFDTFELREMPTDEIRKLLFEAWQAAIKYEQNKPIRTYRWDGVLR
jgi:hypothetical protein